MTRFLWSATLNGHQLKVWDTVAVYGPHTWQYPPAKDRVRVILEWALQFSRPTIGTRTSFLASLDEARYKAMRHTMGELKYGNPDCDCDRCEEWRPRLERLEARGIRP